MTARRNLNAIERTVALVLVGIGLLAGILGWLVFGRDPGQLVGLLGVAAAALGFGQAAGVGKRATFKAEARDWPPREAL